MVGHCKNLAPAWEKLGETFKSNSNVVIAKFDGTANEIDVAGMESSGFPTLFFLAGNKKSSPVKYEGARELDDLIAYVKKNAHNTVSHEEL